MMACRSRRTVMDEGKLAVDEAKRWRNRKVVKCEELELSLPLDRSFHPDVMSSVGDGMKASLNSEIQQRIQRRKVDTKNAVLIPSCSSTIDTKWPVKTAERKRRGERRMAIRALSPVLSTFMSLLPQQNHVDPHHFIPRF
jgi:hypothetical protein